MYFSLVEMMGKASTNTPIAPKAKENPVREMIDYYNFYPWTLFILLLSYTFSKKIFHNKFRALAGLSAANVSRR